MKGVKTMPWWCCPSSQSGDVPIFNLEISNSKITCCENAMLDVADGKSQSKFNKLKLWFKKYFCCCCCFCVCCNPAEEEDEKKEPN